jgi:ribose 5-phosphate isomerase RpiB
MRVRIAADHGGFILKKNLAVALHSDGMKSYISAEEAELPG